MGRTDTSIPIPQQLEDISSELLKWFSVQGDMDDFIFYGELPKEHSER